MALKPVWDSSKCDACGKCAAACNYNAIAVVKDKVLIFNELCHSCGVCSFVCPRGALSERMLKSAKWNQLWTASRLVLRMES